MFAMYGRKTESGAWKMFSYHFHFEQLTIVTVLNTSTVLFLEVYIFGWFQSFPAVCVCVRVACGALAISENTTPDLGTRIWRSLLFLKRCKVTGRKKKLYGPIYSNDCASKACSEKVLRGSHFF